MQGLWAVARTVVPEPLWDIGTNNFQSKDKDGDWVRWEYSFRASHKSYQLTHLGLLGAIQNLFYFLSKLWTLTVGQTKLVQAHLKSCFLFSGEQRANSNIYHLAYHFQLQWDFGEEMLLHSPEAKTRK